MDRNTLISELIADEGMELFPYLDSEKICSIGVGRNLEDNGLSPSELFFLGIKLKDKFEIIELLKKRGLTKDEVLYLLDNDVDRVISELENKLPWLSDKPDVVKYVLCNMCFNMGIYRLLKFKDTLTLLKSDKYKEASIEMLNSKWSSQVGKRATRLSNRIKSINN